MVRVGVLVNALFAVLIPVAVLTLGAWAFGLMPVAAKRKQAAAYCPRNSTCMRTSRPMTVSPPWMSSSGSGAASAAIIMGDRAMGG
jgi:hypothetical protein